MNYTVLGAWLGLAWEGGVLNGGEPPAQAEALQRQAKSVRTGGMQMWG